MIYLLRIMLLFVLLLPIMMFSSCEHRAIAKDNEELERQKSEIAREVKSLKTKIEEDSDDYHALLVQAKNELMRTEKKHQALESEVASLEAEEAELRKQYARDKVNYVIK